jgi:hypothetical protein
VAPRSCNGPRTRLAETPGRGAEGASPAPPLESAEIPRSKLRYRRSARADLLKRRLARARARERDEALRAVGRERQRFERLVARYGDRALNRYLYPSWDEMLRLIGRDPRAAAVRLELQERDWRKRCPEDSAELAEALELVEHLRARVKEARLEQATAALLRSRSVPAESPSRPSFARPHDASQLSQRPRERGDTQGARRRPHRRPTRRSRGSSDPGGAGEPPDRESGGGQHLQLQLAEPTSWQRAATENRLLELGLQVKDHRVYPQDPLRSRPLRVSDRRAGLERTAA